MPLKPGWLKEEIEDVAALQRAERKITDAASRIRRNGYTQPMSIEFTVAEIRAMDYMVRAGNGQLTTES